MPQMVKRNNEEVRRLSINLAPAAKDILLDMQDRYLEVAPVRISKIAIIEAALYAARNMGFDEFMASLRAIRQEE